MSNSDMVLGILAACALMLVCIVAAIGPIHQWERANNYPYGKVCNSVFTGWQDTCPR